MYHYLSENKTHEQKNMQFNHRHFVYFYSPQAHLEMVPDYV